MSSSEERELKELLEKLRKMKEENGVGGKDDKKKNGDNFMELKTSLIERYKTIKTLVKQRDDTQKSGKNPRDVVVLSQRIRNELTELKLEFEQLTKILKEETSKKKTKFTPEELAIRSEILLDLAGKVQELSNTTSRGGVPGGGGPGGFVPASTFTPSIAAFVAEEDEESKFGGPSTMGGGGGGAGKFVRETEMSQLEKQGLAQIEKNRLEEDKILDLIGNEMKDLKEIALGLNEEVTKQKYILEDIDDKMGKVSEKMDNTIAALKKTNKESSRGGDKLCMDAICLVLLLGILSVIYNMVKGGGL